MHTPERVRLISPESVTPLSKCSKRGATSFKCPLLTTNSSLRVPQQVTIENLSDKVLLNIFRYYLDASPRFWLRLVHICRKWRRIVFANQRALCLRLFATYGTPVLKTLDRWPALPIVVQYGGSLALDPPVPRDEDNIMAALKQSDRVTSISLTVTSSLLEKLSTTERPFLQLKQLVLLSRDAVRQTLPRAFQWGPHLRCLHSTRIAFPALLHLLYSSKNLVDLRLHEVINPLHISPEVLIDALSGMPQLRILSLHLLTPANYISLELPPPPPPEERIVFPVLTHLYFRGIAEYLEGLVARIDTPRLGDIEVTLFDKFILDPPKFIEFIDRIEIQKSPFRANIRSSERVISISFTRPEAPTRLKLQVLCKPSARRLLYMIQICNGLSTYHLGVEHLLISATRPPRGQDDRDRDEWAELIYLFRGTKLIHVAGDHSTNIMHALQLRHRLPPALHILYIAQPGPCHAPLREAVVSFMTSCRLSGRSMTVKYEQPSHISELRGAGPFSQQAKIEMLCDGVLLNIFQHYLDASPRHWPLLAHVCRSWRQTIFTSPLGLDLRLYCTYGTPVLKNLDCWPPLPLVMIYGGSPMRPPPAPEDEDNIMTALERSNRVYSIRLTVTSSLLKRLSGISEPISELEKLVLLSQDNVQLTLPNAFWWGHRLRTLHSTRIAIPSLPQLLSPSQDLVDLQLHEIPRVGYFPPEAFANALCGMTQLETLSLHFLSLPPRRNYLGFPLPPGDHVVLPALTRFKYRGTSKYLDCLVGRIDAPRLGDIDITFFNQPTLDASQLGLFVNRIEMWRSPLRAEILFSEGVISITFIQPRAFKRLGLQISCEQLGWRLFSISQICGHFSSFLFNVEDLDIKTNGLSSVPDDMDDEQWQQPIRPFDNVKDLRVAGDLATDILRALRPTDEGHNIVLPALRYLYVQGTTFVNVPSRDSIESFLILRQLSNHPVQLYYGSPQQPQQFTDFLRDQIMRNLMTHEKAQEHASVFQTSTSYAFQGLNIPQQISSGLATGGMAGGYTRQQMAALSWRERAPASNPRNSLQRGMQAQQDSRYARQLNTAAQGQQQNGSASRVGQNRHSHEMGLPRGQVSLQQNFIQPSPSVHSANIQSSVAPPASQPTPLGGAQVHGHHKNFAEMPVPQLSNVYDQLTRAVKDGEKNLNAAGAGRRNDMRRRALRARLDSQKQLLINIRDLINLKRQGGDPAQQTANGASLLGASKQTTGLDSAPERPLQYRSPLSQLSVNQTPPRGRIPTSQQSFVPSVTAQSNLTQMSSHSANGLPSNGGFTQIPGAPPPPPPRAPHLALRRTIQCSQLPPLSEDRFKVLFTQYAKTTALRLNDRDFVIDGRPVSAWALHRAVFTRNGFESVTANDEWPAVGAALGFPSFIAEDPTQLLRCAPNIAHQLQQLYNDSLRHFEQAYLNSVIARLRSSQALSQVSAQTSQQQARSRRPTDADYQTPWLTLHQMHLP
ncbi:hypothetical protein EDB87DRAFT_975753 [Lactarius vividus]|nr:hypothetical protein EDB87DRAFT_975753 [Lactarius vividus]